MSFRKLVGFWVVVFFLGGGGGGNGEGWTGVYLCGVMETENDNVRR